MPEDNGNTPGPEASTPKRRAEELAVALERIEKEHPVEEMRKMAREKLDLLRAVQLELKMLGESAETEENVNKINAIAEELEELVAEHPAVPQEAAPPVAIPKKKGLFKKRIGGQGQKELFKKKTATPDTGPKPSAPKAPDVAPDITAATVAADTGPKAPDVAPAPPAVEPEISFAGITSAAQEAIRQEAIRMEEARQAVAASAGAEAPPAVETPKAEPEIPERPERGPVEMPPEMFIELIGSDRLADMLGRSMKEGERERLTADLAALFDTEPDSRKKAILERQLKAFGFDSFEAFRDEWKATLHERVMAGIDVLVRQEIDRAVAEDPELQTLEKQGTIGQRIRRGVWNAIPAATAGAAVAIALAPVGPVISIGAAGAVAKMVNRFFRAGNRRAEEERIKDNAALIETKKKEVQGRIEDDMLARAKAGGGIELAAAMSATLRERLAEAPENTDVANAKLELDMRRMIAEHAEREDGAEAATEKKLDHLMATMRLQNEEARSAHAPPESMEKKPFWTRVMEDLKNSGSAKDLYLHDKSVKKRAIGYAMEGAAGFAAGAAIGLSAGSFALRSLARAGVGFVSGGAEEFARMKMREKGINTEALDAELARIEGENKEQAEALRQRLDKILPKEMSTREKMLSVLKAGAKRGAIVATLGAAFDGLRGLVNDYVRGEAEASKDTYKGSAAEKAMRAKEEAAAGIIAAAERGKAPAIDAEQAMKQFMAKLEYETVGDKEGLVHSSTRDFLYDSKVRADYMKLSEFKQFDAARLDKIAESLKSHGGDYTKLSKGDYDYAVDVMKEMQDHNDGWKGVSVTEKGRVATVYNYDTKRHELVLLDKKGNPTFDEDVKKYLETWELKEGEVKAAELPEIKKPLGAHAAEVELEIKGKEVLKPIASQLEQMKASGKFDASQIAEADKLAKNIYANARMRDFWSGKFQEAGAVRNLEEQKLFHREWARHADWLQQHKQALTMTSEDIKDLEESTAVADQALAKLARGYEDNPAVLSLKVPEPHAYDKVVENAHGTDYGKALNKKVETIAESLPKGGKGGEPLEKVITHKAMKALPEGMAVKNMQEVQAIAEKAAGGGVAGPEIPTVAAAPEELLTAPEAVMERLKETIVAGPETEAMLSKVASIVAKHSERLGAMDPEEKILATYPVEQAAGKSTAWPEGSHAVKYFGPEQKAYFLLDNEKMFFPAPEGKGFYVEDMKSGESYHANIKIVEGKPEVIRD